MQGRDIIVMGVSGTGKSTVGTAMAEALGRPFVEGDDHHPDDNRAKMAGGTALTNADRDAWIAALAAAVNAGPPAIVACSALNPTVRRWIGARFVRSVRYVHLTAPKALIAERLAARTDHFFDPALLESQCAALDAPDDALCVSVDQPVDAIVAAALAGLDEDAQQ